MKEDKPKGFVKIRHTERWFFFLFRLLVHYPSTLAQSGFPCTSVQTSNCPEKEGSQGGSPCPRKSFGTNWAPGEVDFSVNRSFWVALGVSLRSCCSNSVLYCLCFGPTPNFNNIVRKMLQLVGMSAWMPNLCQPVFDPCYFHLDSHSYSINFTVYIYLYI